VNKCNILVPKCFLTDLWSLIEPSRSLLIWKPQPYLLDNVSDTKLTNYRPFHYYTQVLYQLSKLQLLHIMLGIGITCSAG